MQTALGRECACGPLDDGGVQRLQQMEQEHRSPTCWVLEKPPGESTTGWESVEAAAVTLWEVKRHTGPPAWVALPPSALQVSLALSADKASHYTSCWWSPVCRVQLRHYKAGQRMVLECRGNELIKGTPTLCLALGYAFAS